MDSALPEPPSLHPTAVTLMIAGFWRRIFAAVIDGVILGAFGAVLSIFWFDYFVNLGGWGRLLGFVIALAYYSILNGFEGDGKTLGKRALGIEVVDGSGAYLSPGRSVVRSLILEAPFFLNGALLPATALQGFLGVVDLVLVFGLGGSIAYLYLFNRRTRQSVHDLAVGSFVVRGVGPGKVAALPIWRPHLVIAGAVWACALVFALLAPVLEKAVPGTVNAAYSELLAVPQAEPATGEVRSATVFLNYSTSTLWGGSNRGTSSSTSLQSTVMGIGKSKDDELLADHMARVIFETYPKIGKMDRVQVTVIYGYDIGIASSWIRHNYVHTPAEWAARLRAEY